MRSPIPRYRRCALGFAAALLALATSPGEAVERGPTRAASAASSAASESEARVIVQYRADATLMRALSASGTGTAAPQHAQVLAARLGLALTDGLPAGPRSQVVRATGISSADLAARLSAQSDVEFAVVDQRMHALRVPNDSLFSAGQTTTPTTGQWYLRKAGSDGEVASIDAESAWDVTTGASTVVVAVIDTGITSHPDLAGKILPGYDFISDPVTAGDGDGRDSDPTDPGDGVTPAQAASISACSNVSSHSSWHGTQTAGLIGAATNNGVGIAGLGWNVMLLPLRALGKCGGSESDVAAAIQWAAGIDIPGVPHNPNKAQVINLSLGGTSGLACDSAYQSAITAAINQGVVVVAAAGNDGLALGSPANCTGVIAVAGVRHVGTKVGYSDLGSNVTIAAPAGNCVNDTGSTCLYPLTTTSNDGAYTIGNPIYTDGDTDPTLGTSFSTPLVAGTVALMLSANPSLTLAQVTSALRATARPFPLSGAPPAQRTNGGPLLPVAACTAPTSVAQGYECYCTTATCGAGLLDAGAAVAAVETAIARVTPSATSVTAGGSVTFDGSASTAATSLLTVTGYQWAITSGSGVAAFSGAVNQSAATVVTSGAGSFTVTLTVTDSGGHTSTSSSTVTVAAVVTPTTPTTTSTSSSGGGGGGVSFGWLLGLLAAVLALWLVRPRAGQR